MAQTAHNNSSSINISSDSTMSSPHNHAEGTEGALSPTSFYRKHGFLDFSDLLPTEQQIEPSQAPSTGNTPIHSPRSSMSLDDAYEPTDTLPKPQDASQHSTLPKKTDWGSIMHPFSDPSTDITGLELDHKTWNAILAEGKLSRDDLEAMLFWASRHVVRALKEVSATSPRLQQGGEDHGIFVGAPYVPLKWGNVTLERLRGMSEDLLKQAILKTMVKLRDLRDEVVEARRLS